MILQLRQIRLTDAITFMVYSKFPVCRTGRSFRTKNNSCPGQVVGCEFDRDLVPWENPYVMHTHLARNVAQYHVAIFKPDTKRCIGKVLDDFPLHLNDVVFCHFSINALAFPYP